MAVSSAAIVRIVLNSLSAIFCFGLCLYLLSKERRKYLPSFLIGNVLLTSGIFSIVVLILSITPIIPGGYLSNFTCELLRAILVYSRNANALWALMIYIIMNLMYVRRFKNEQNNASPPLLENFS